MMLQIFISYCAAIQTDHSHENKISDVAYGMRKRVVDLIRNLEFIFEDSAKHNFEMHWKESPRPAHSLLNPFTEAWELGNSRSCLNLDLKDDDNPFTEAWEQLDYRPYLNLEDELYNYEELELFHAIDQHIYDVFIKSYLTNEEINKVCEKCKEQYIIATDYRNIASKYNLYMLILHLL